MSETAELAAALAAAQAELPEVGKNRTAEVKNKDGKYLYSYSYADLADVSAAVLPVLGRHGLAFTAFPSHQPDGKFGLRYYLLHSGGGALEGFFEIDDKGGMQLVGGRITYARRYCLCAVTGVTADEDVDARDDSRSPTVRRQQPRDNGARQPQQAVQRRTQSPPPAQAANPPAAASAPPGAGGDLPPLPGEEEDPTTSGASYSARAPGSGSRATTAEPSPSSSGGSATTPDDTDYGTHGTATRGKGGQLTALWTVLSTEFGFTSTDADKAQARAVCEHVINRELAGGTTGDLSYNEARTVLDTLAHWQHQAAKEGRHPREYMVALMVAQDGGPGE